MFLGNCALKGIRMWELVVKGLGFRVQGLGLGGHRGTSLIRNRLPLGPYSSIYLGLYGFPSGGGGFL